MCWCNDHDFPMHHFPLSVPNSAKRAAIQLVCALLLFAQHIGVTHAIWHAAQQRPLHEQGHGSALDQDYDSPESRDVSNQCALDALFGQVLGGAALAGSAFTAEKPLASVPAHAPAAYAASDTLTPRSRGPPALL